MSSINFKKLIEEAKNQEGTKTFKESINNKDRVYGYNLNLFNLDKGSVWASGYSNRCRDGKLVALFDWDNMEEEWVADDILNLQTNGIYVPGFLKPVLLETTILIKSSEKSFLGVCLSKYLPIEYVQLLIHSNVDSAFLNVPRFQTTRAWINRMFDKGSKKSPEIVRIFRTRDTRQQSNGHYELLKLLYPKLPIILKRADNYSKEDVQLIRYKTSVKRRL